jgi:hypothetical protein
MCFGTRLTRASLSVALDKKSYAPFSRKHISGEWTGTATSIGQQCKRVVFKLIVEGQVVLGQARFERDVPSINGTVDENCALGATIGFQPFRGRFTRDRFEGTFNSFDCEWRARLRRAT